MRRTSAEPGRPRSCWRRGVGLRVMSTGLCLAAVVVLLGACSDSSGDTAEGSAATVGSSETSDPVPGDEQEDSRAGEQGGPGEFRVEVWADNWMAVYVDGELIGQDSVPITTERSFNAETFTFEASHPFTVAIEARDFSETESGIEYIGEPNQQMGDGGLIAQVIDTSTGEVVAATDSQWSVLVIQRAPLNTACEDDPDPDATCEHESTDAPTGWTEADFDDTGWDAATEWSTADVAPKGGYDEIDWDPEASLIWGGDLDVDNTVLARVTVQAPE